MAGVPEQVRLAKTQVTSSTDPIFRRKRDFNRLSIDDEGEFVLRLMPVLMHNELEMGRRRSSPTEGPDVDDARL